VFVCPITRRSLRGWRSPAGITFPMWDGIPVLTPEPDALIASAGALRPPTGLLYPFMPPSMLGAPGALGAWLATETRTPTALAAAWGTQHAPPGPGLDAGCGLGAMALAMASRGRPTWAIDHNPRVLVAARDLLLGRTREAPWPRWPGDRSTHPIPILPLRPSQVHFAVADLCTPPFAEGSFAWIHLGSVLPTEPAGRRTMLAHAQALLVEGGLLTVVTDHPTESLLEGDPAADLLAALGETGLSVVAQAPAVPHIERCDARRYSITLAQCVAARREGGG
jgi:SAM-dependent methyltransferase